MLDPDVPDERRDEIAAQTRQRIEAGGTLKHDASWGMRKLAYEIRQRTEADYRLFRFEGESGVLDELNHNLRIADGVLRFRIFKVDPRSPAVVPPAPVASTTSAPARGSRRSQEAPAREEPDAPAPEKPEAPAREEPGSGAEETSEQAAAPEPQTEAATSPESGPTPAAAPEAEAEPAPASPEDQGSEPPETT